MSTDQWSRIEELFHQAADLAPADRAAFLDRVCAGDPELRREVDSLLAADTAQDEIVQAAMAHAVGQILPDQEDDADMAGTRMGRYTITGLIGKGGMGAVYRAIREDDFRMQVAIKLLKRGTDTDAALSRFRSERQILAGLQHPNIAHLLDGGATETGLPYLVMEYVDGIPLLDYAAPLSLRQRLELFRTVCSAVQYAHQNLIVHRDIKPANILVTAAGIPKLLDFGIAKLLDPGVEGGTLLGTATGLRAMTPDYASPEQVRGEPVTTATDVYSLGVVLYELLTNQRVHHFKTYSASEIEKEICENEPRKPSAVNQDLDPDLDTIVLTALRKEPGRRYASVEQFSADLERFLRDLPILARKESVVYRGRKFVRRNRTPISAAALTGIVILALSIGVNWFHPSSFVPDRASIAVLPFTEIGSGKDEQYLADQLMDGLLKLLKTVPGLRVAGSWSIAALTGKNPRSDDLASIGKTLNVESILKATVTDEGSRAKIDIQLIRASDGQTLWSSIYDRPKNETFTVQQEIARAITKALHLKSPESNAVQSAAMVTSPEAYNYYLQGEFFRGKGNVENAVRYFELTIQADPRYAPAWVALGDAHAVMAGAAKIPPAEGYRKARQEVEKALALNPDIAEAHALIGQIKVLHEWDWAGADASLQRAVALAPGDAGVLRVSGLLARILGRLDKAVALYRRGVALDPIYSNGYKNLGMTLYYARMPREASAALEKALELNPQIEYAHAYLGLVRLAQARPQESLAEARAEKGPYGLCVLAIAYHVLGDKRQSDSKLENMIAKWQSDFPYQIAEVYSFRGEKDMAFRWLDKAFAQRDDSLPEMKTDPLLANLRSDPRYASLLERMGLHVY